MTLLFNTVTPVRQIKAPWKLWKLFKISSAPSYLLAPVPRHFTKVQGRSLQFVYTRSINLNTNYYQSRINYDINTKLDQRLRENNL